MYLSRVGFVWFFFHGNKVCSYRFDCCLWRVWVCGHGNRHNRYGIPSALQACAFACSAVQCSVVQPVELAWLSSALFWIFLFLLCVFFFSFLSFFVLKKDYSRMYIVSSQVQTCCEPLSITQSTTITPTVTMHIHCHTHHLGLIPRWLALQKAATTSCTQLSKDMSVGDWGEVQKRKGRVGREIAHVCRRDFNVHTSIFETHVQLNTSYYSVIFFTASLNIESDSIQYLQTKTLCATYSVCTLFAELWRAAFRFWLRIVLHCGQDIGKLVVLSSWWPHQALWFLVCILIIRFAHCCFWKQTTALAMTNISYQKHCWYALEILL